ncbi:MAG: TIR domain-containing protein [Candidatus Heimdallarchaeota archaeon]
MGGSGGGAHHVPAKTKNANELRRIAQESIKNTEKRLTNEPQNIIYPQKNVFLSFHMEDENLINLFRHQAKSDRFELKFRDYSAKEPFDSQWKKHCSQRISQSSTVAVMIGKETASRSAVKWEIAEAYRQGKRVVGIRGYRDSNHKIPEQMVKNNAKIVDWNLSDINETLYDLAN